MLAPYSVAFQLGQPRPDRHRVQVGQARRPEGWQQVAAQQVAVGRLGVGAQVDRGGLPTSGPVRERVVRPSRGSPTGLGPGRSRPGPDAGSQPSWWQRSRMLAAVASPIADLPAARRAAGARSRTGGGSSGTQRPAAGLDLAGSNEVDEIALGDADVATELHVGDAASAISRRTKRTEVPRRSAACSIDSSVSNWMASLGVRRVMQQRIGSWWSAPPGRCGGVRGHERRPTGRATAPPRLHSPSRRTPRMRP